MTKNINIKSDQEESSNIKNNNKDEIQTIKEDIIGIKDIISKYNGTSSKKDLKSIAKQTGQKVYSLFNNGQKQFGQTKDKYEEKIKQSPFFAIGTAFLCGALLISIFKNRK